MEKEKNEDAEKGREGRKREREKGKRKSTPPEKSCILIVEEYLGGRIYVIMILDIILVNCVVYGLCLLVSYLVFSFGMWVRLITGIFIVLFTCHMASFCAYTVQCHRIGEIRSLVPVRLIQISTPILCGVVNCTAIGMLNILPLKVSALTFSIMGFLFSVSACFFATKSFQMKK